MTVPVLKQQEFIDYLKERGFKLVEDKYWEEFNRVIFEKDGITFPFQIREKYFFPFVCQICKDFDIAPPPDHKKCFDQMNTYYEKRRKRNND
jgi:hypothetical protein